jgi:NRPS condensation-like uncharacterized protein
MVNAHHAAMDAVGVLRVVHSVARAYAGQPERGPDVDPHPSRQHLDRLVLPGAAARMRRLLALAGRLRDLVAPPARVAPDGGRDEDGYGFHHRTLPAPDTATLVALDHPGTVNDVLLASLHLTIARWNAQHGEASRRIGVLVPANLRAPDWRREVVGNFSLPARLVTSPTARRDAASTLRSLTAQTSRKKASGMGTALVEVLRYSPRLPRWAKRAGLALVALTRYRLVDTAMLSNIGRVEDPPSFGPEAGPTVGMWFSPPGRMPLGLTVGTVTAAGCLHLVFRHSRRLLDDDGVRRFADLYLAELDGVVAAAASAMRAS